MLVLGLDPGSRTTGYGLVESTNSRISYVASGCIRLPQDSMPQRLLKLYQAIIQIIAQYSPDIIVIEKVFVKNNVSSALKLGQARGVLLLAAATRTQEIFEYSPREIKQAVVGYGAAEKCQMQTMVTSLLSLSKQPQEDAADALAAAICHLHTYKWHNKIQHAVIS